MRPESAPSPEAIVDRYYRALQESDVAALRQMMQPASYRMTLEAYGLKRTFSDPAFKKILHRMESDEMAMAEAEKYVAEFLTSESRRMEVVVQETEPLGPERCAVHYRENGCPKKLYFSQTPKGWKIDYYAGRKRN